MILVGPNYLTASTLPYASDIFYHKKITYLLPTGFHPIEINSVIGFPDYCKRKSIALPNVIWEMCNLYFESTKNALENYDILKPLHNNSVSVIETIYARDRKVIDESKKFLQDNVRLLECFKRTYFDLQFASREVISHILYGIFFEEGYEGAVQYIIENSRSQDDFIMLIAATIINRLKLFEGDSIEKILLYEHSWEPLINAYMDLSKGNRDGDQIQNDSSDSAKIEQMCYKLFEIVLMPIFGKCDTQYKSSLIAKIAIKKQEEINALKEQCRMIASDTLLLNTNDIYLKQEKLNNMIKEKIIEPLSFLSEKPLKDIKDLLSNFLLDSTVVGGVISLVQQFDVNTLGLSAAAGAISTGTRYILSEESKKVCNPSSLLLTGLKKMKIKYEDYEKQIQEISIKQVCDASKFD